MVKISTHPSKSVGGKIIFQRAEEKMINRKVMVESGEWQVWPTDLSFLFLSWTYGKTMSG